MKSKMDNVRLALEMGYKISLLTNYFSAISNQQISEERIQRTIDYVIKEIESLAIYYKALFNEKMPKYQPIECQDDIVIVMTKIYNRIETMIHVYYYGAVESAFNLGGILSLTEMAPPAEEYMGAVIKKIKEWMADIGLKPKKLRDVIESLGSSDDEERAKARQSILEHILRKKNNSLNGMIKDLELEIGIPSGIKVVKRWK